jgi:hypothetical protein
MIVYRDFTTTRMLRNPERGSRFKADNANDDVIGIFPFTGHASGKSHPRL